MYVGDNAEKDFRDPKQLGMRTLYFVNEDGLYSHTDFVEEEEITSMMELRSVLI